MACYFRTPPALSQIDARRTILPVLSPTTESTLTRNLPAPTKWPATWMSCSAAGETFSQTGSASVYCHDSLELDFLCIRPFEFGNERVGYLLSLLLSYHVGFEVGRYISFRRSIEQNRERRREQHCLIASRQWRQGQHDPWPYIEYVLSRLAQAYNELQSLADSAQARKGAKTEMVLNAIQIQSDEFKLVDIERLCPNVGRDLIRTLLAYLRAEGEVTCTGRSRGIAPSDKSKRN